MVAQEAKFRIGKYLDRHMSVLPAAKRSLPCMFRTTTRHHNRPVVAGLCPGSRTQLQYRDLIAN
jgi:hypothetical protein